MSQYGVLVYLPTPADPMALAPDYLAALEAYPAQVKELGAKVLGSSYFAGQRGFAFESAATGMAVLADTVKSGSLAESDLAAAAFFVLSAPNVDVAVQAAKLHPAAAHGGLELRPLVPAPPR
jgi:hypothetical protein